MNNRNTNIDILKGIGIIAVIVGHLTTIWHLRGLIYSFHMPLFFLASGYFFKYQKNKDFIYKLINKLLKPYIFFSFIIFIISYIFNSTTEHQNFHFYLKMKIFADGYYNDTKIWGNMPPIGILWFLPALFWCRIIFNNIQTYKYNYLIAIFISITSVYLGKNIINIPFGILEGGQAVIFYMMGTTYSNSHIQTRINRFIQNIFIASIWIIIASYNYMSMADFSYSNWPLNIIGAISGTWCIYKLILYFSRIPYQIINIFKDIFIWFGKNSLYIFCIHSMLMSIQNHILPLNDTTWSITVIIHIITATLLTLFYNYYRKKTYGKIN